MAIVRRGSAGRREIAARQAADGECVYSFLDPNQSNILVQEPKDMKNIVKAFKYSHSVQRKS
jgi:hypothetical protein